MLDRLGALAEAVLRTTTANSRLQLGEGAVLRYLREHVMLKLIDLPSVQRWATAVASQLGVSYRKGPLGGRHSLLPSKRPEPGDRVPDLACLREDGSRPRLHGELGSHWVLLVPTTDRAILDAAPSHQAHSECPVFSWLTCRRRSRASSSWANDGVDTGRHRSSR